MAGCESHFSSLVDPYDFHCFNAGGPVHVEFSVLIMNIRDVIELSQVQWDYTFWVKLL